MNSRTSSSPGHGASGWMIGKTAAWLATLLSFMFAWGSASSQTASYPFPQNFKYAKAVTVGNPYNDKIQLIYDDWKTKYYETGTITLDGVKVDAGRVKFVSGAAENSESTVSEGIAYGMLIFVYMDNAKNDTKADFDRLWNYYQANVNQNGVMNWWVDGFTGKVWKDEPNNANGATDAEVDVAQALLMAYKQWGDAKYLAAAEKMMNIIWTYEVDFSNEIKPGDQFNTYKNACYLITNAFQLFHDVNLRLGRVNVQKWDVVTANSYAYMKEVAHEKTGLIPDWTYNKEKDYEKIVGVKDSKFESYYLYDAVRIPWRLAQAYAWYEHPEAKALANAINFWANDKFEGNPANALDGYNLDGSVPSIATPGFTDKGTNHNACFTGSFACGGMVDPTYKSYMETGYLSTVEKDPYGAYYTTSIQLLTLLTMSGNTPNFWEMAPRCSSTSLTSCDELEVMFSKKLTSTAALDPAAWTVTTDRGANTIPVSTVTIDPNDAFRVVLSLSSSILDPAIQVNYNGKGGLLDAEGSAPAPAFPRAYDVENKDVCGIFGVLSLSTSVDGKYIIVGFSKSMKLSSFKKENFKVKVGEKAVAVDREIFDIEADPLNPAILKIVLKDVPFTNLISPTDKPIWLSYSGLFGSSLDGKSKLRKFSDITQWKNVENGAMPQKCTTIDDFDPVTTGVGGWDPQGVYFKGDKFDVAFIDPSNADNKVLRFERGTTHTEDDWFSAPRFDVTTTDWTVNKLFAEEGQYIMKFRAQVNAAAAGAELTVNLQDGTSLEPWVGQVSKKLTLPATAGAWVDYEISFEGEKDKSTKFTRIEFRVNDAQVGVGEVLMLDNIELCSPKPSVTFKAGYAVEANRLEVLMTTAMTLPLLPAEVAALAKDFLVTEEDGTKYIPTGLSLKAGNPSILVLSFDKVVFAAGAKGYMLSYTGTKVGALDSRPLEVFKDQAIVNVVGRTPSTGWSNDFNDKFSYRNENLPKTASAAYGLTPDYTSGVLNVKTNPSGTFKHAANGDYAAFAITADKEYWDLTKNPRVRMRVKVPADAKPLHIRVDLKDAKYERTTDQCPVEVVPADGAFHDVVFDFKGNFNKQYGQSTTVISEMAGIVDASSIIQALFYFWQGDKADLWHYDVGNTATIESIEIGASISIKLSAKTINEGEKLMADVSTDADVYILPNEYKDANGKLVTLTRDLGVFAMLYEAGTYSRTSLKAAVSTALPTSTMKAGYYRIVAVDPSTNAMTDLRDVTITDKTAPLILEASCGKFGVGNYVQGVSNEDGTLYLIPATYAGLWTQAGIAGANAGTAKLVAGQKAGILLRSDKVDNGVEYILAAADGAGNLALRNNECTIEVFDGQAPTITSAVVGVDGDDYPIVTVTADEASTVYLVDAVTYALVEAATDKRAKLEDTKLYVESITSDGSSAILYLVDADYTSLPAGIYYVYALDVADNVSVATMVKFGDACALSPALASATMSKTSVSLQISADPATSIAALTVAPSADALVSTVAWASQTATKVKVEQDPTDKLKATITGLAEATDVVITATVTDCKGTVKKATTLVTVKGMSSGCDPTAVVVKDGTAAVTEATIQVGSSKTLTAAGVATGCTLAAGDEKVTWELGADAVGYLSVTDGKITALKVTTAPVTVNAVSVPKPSISAAIAVTVTEVPVESVKIMDELVDVTGETLELELGKTLEFSAPVLPSTATNKTVAWSKTGTAVSVADGLVKALSAGTATVTATAGGKSATVTIKVVLPKPVSISVSPASLSFLLNGAAQQITATISPSTASQEVVITPSAECTGVVTVVGATVTPAKVGECSITVASKADATISKVIAVSVAEGKTDVTDVEITTVVPAVKYVGDEMDLAVVISPVKATVKTIAWKSSNEDVATVDATGHVVVVGVGEVTITATSNDPDVTFSDEVTFTAQKLAISEITPADESLTLKKGETKLLSYTYKVATLPDDIKITSDKPSVITVAGKTVTAVEGGTANLVYTSAATGLSVKVPVTVTVPALAITFTEATSKATAGTSVSLASLVSFAPENTTDKRVTWEVTKGTSTIGADGLFKASAVAETAEVTVTSVENPSLSATILIAVSSDCAAVVTGINVAASVTALEEGVTATLSGSVLPGNACKQGITWAIESGDEYIALSGTKVTPIIDALPANVKTVKAVVTATDEDNNIVEKIEFTISHKVLVSSITIPAALTIKTNGQTEIDPITILPITAEDKTVTLKVKTGDGSFSGNNFTAPATVQKVTVVAVANDGSLVTSNPCTITVVAECSAVGSIALAGAPAELAYGESINLNDYFTAVAAEADVAICNAVLTYTSNDERVVITNGTVKNTVAVGTTVLFTAKSAEGKTKTLSILFKKKDVECTPTALTITASNAGAAFATASTLDINQATDLTVVIERKFDVSCALGTKVAWNITSKPSDMLVDSSSNGVLKLTAVKGTGAVKVTASYNGLESNEFTFVVKAPVCAATKIIPSFAKEVLDLNDNSYLLTFASATVEPACAASLKDNVLYSTTSTSVSIDGTMITAVSKGTASILVTLPGTTVQAVKTIEVVDKTELKALEATTSDFKGSNIYMAPANATKKTAFDAAYVSAIEIIGNKVATQKSIDDAYSKLNAAFKAFPIPDMTKLLAAIDAAKAISVMAEYEAGNKALATAIANATTSSENYDQLQAEVDKAVTALNTAAKTALKAGLDAKIAAAELVYKDPAYASQKVLLATLDSKIKAAKLVVNNTSTTTNKITGTSVTVTNAKAEADKQIDLLNKAMSALTPLDEIPASSVKLYPNPLRGVVTVEAEDVKSLDVVDADGRVILSVKGASFNANKLAEGAYFIKVTTKKGQATVNAVK